MAFKNLEQRYNEKVNSLYGAATLKFNGGKASSARTDDPLIVRKPGEGYWNAAEGRAAPINSAREDLKRLTLFQIRPAQIRFLLKQQTLQTGNTFKFTRIINPKFVTANAVPFLHVKRNGRPLGELKGKTNTDYNNVKKMGTMQRESYNRLAKYKVPRFVDNHLARNGLSPNDIKRINSVLKFIRNPLKNVAKFAAKKAVGVLKKTVGNKLAKAFGPITSTISALNPALKRNVGEEVSWNVSRPELAKDSLVEQINTANYQYQEALAQELSLTGQADAIQYIKYFNSAGGIKSSGQAPTLPGQDDAVRSLIARRSDDRTQNGVLPSGTSGRISYITDPANVATKKLLKNVATAYNSLPGVDGDPKQKETFEDVITVAIAMGNGEPVKFRAFIKDLQQSATPEYKPYQYIGRIEKFYSYSTVQREVSFKLNVMAYSKDELIEVWRRINYLTGLVYPFGFHKGIYQPNIARLTIGNLYYDQPGYFSSLNMNFTDMGWDIDELPDDLGFYNGGVPMGAELDMKFILIEKASRISSSPFYSITEEDFRFDKVIKTDAPQPSA